MGWASVAMPDAPSRLERSDSNPKATRKVYYRRGDVSRGQTQTLGLETLVESNQAKMIVIQFPDASEENPEDDMYKFKRWQIHFMPADHVAGPFKGCLIRVECSLRERDGCKDWPMNPPQMRTLDPIWHPNVHLPDCKICHPLVYPKDGVHANGAFTPQHTLMEIVPDVLLLFTEHGIKNGLEFPLNSEAAAEVAENYSAYCRKASAMAQQQCIDVTADIPKHQLGAWFGGGEASRGEHEAAYEADPELSLTHYADVKKAEGTTVANAEPPQAKGEAGKEEGGEGVMAAAPVGSLGGISQVSESEKEGREATVTGGKDEEKCACVVQ